MPVPFVRREWHILEPRVHVIRHSTPPPELLLNEVSQSDTQLFWVALPSFSVRIEPVDGEGMVKLLAVSEGEAVVQQAGRRVCLRPGNFTWVDAGSSFELASSSGRQLQLRLPRERLERLHHGLDLRPAVSRGRGHAGERIVAELVGSIAARAELAAPTARGALSLLLESLGLGPRRPDVEHERVDRALRDILARLGEPGLQPSDVAELQGVSRRYLDGRVREHTGKTMAQHIRAMRLERAAEGLRLEPTRTAADIAARWGFRDASHFSRVFRKHYGVSPSVYRRAAWSRPQ